MNFNKQLKDGLIYQNPVLVQVLGMCSTMAITTSVANGFGMGISVLIILTLSNIFISLLRKIIPNEVRIACYIVADRAKAALDELDSIEADDLRVRRRHFLCQRARDALVHDGVELGELFSVLEDDQADGMDVHAAVLPKNNIAERLAQRAQQRLVIF